MVKGGTLTKSEKFYIQQNPDNLTIHELAKELDRTPRYIAKYYINPEEKKNTEPEKPKDIANKESPMFTLMGRHKRGKQNVATVMTKAASELADSTRPERIKMKKETQAAIHKPKG